MSRIPLGLVVVAWASAVAFGQQQSPSESAPAHNTFVLAGCLGAPLNETSPFTLSSASPVGQAPPAGPAGSTVIGTRGEKLTYELQPTSGVNQQGVDAAALKPHVGQRVEVTVRPIDTVAPPPPPGTSAEPKADAERKPQRFSVTAIKRVSGTCT